MQIVFLSSAQRPSNISFPDRAKVAEIPDPAFLALKHQACRPEVGCCAQKCLTYLGLTNVRPSENGSGASAKSSAVPGPKSALQLANPERIAGSLELCAK
jgi:hypothetical protein